MNKRGQFFLSRIVSATLQRPLGPRILLGRHRYRYWYRCWVRTTAAELVASPAPWLLQFQFHSSGTFALERVLGPPRHSCGLASVPVLGTSAGKPDHRRWRRALHQHHGCFVSISISSAPLFLGAHGSATLAGTVGAVLVRCGRNQDLPLGLANASALVASIVQYLRHLPGARPLDRTLAGTGIGTVLGMVLEIGPPPLGLSSPAPLVASIYQYLRHTLERLRSPPLTLLLGLASVPVPVPCWEAGPPPLGLASSSPAP
jgi:hypothetical protein